ncbi:MAG: metalloprotease family protein [Ignisphaera sp.]|nr:metalloprotease family protein [Ignisphaera sp.]MCX8167973.1 metalloprotease family protein [Ignisphaera sp.]MDW8085570.1 metalloprotease family protein [Ignisphaera sp.]
MKLKNAAYIILGFTVSWMLSSFLNISGQIYVTILALLALIGILHELLHFVAINMFGIGYRFVVKGLYVGFIINTDRKEKYLLTALFPQILTIVVLLLYMLTLDGVMLALSILHTAISIEDIGRCIKYTFHK